MEWGLKYPKIEVEQIAIQIEEELASITLRGDLPLYKSHGFEKEIKDWFIKQVGRREEDLK